MRPHVAPFPAARPSRRSGPRRWVGVLATIGLLGLGACTSGVSESAAPAPAGTTADAPAGQFGGALEGTDALIGISAGPERVTVYVCDDAHLAEWFLSTTPSDALTLSSSGGAVAELALGSDRVTGTVTFADGSRHDFTATPQSQPAIHRAQAASEDGSVVAGWVTVGDRTVGTAGFTPKGAISPTVTTAPALPKTPTLTLPTPKLSLPAQVVTVTNDATFKTANRGLTFVVAGVGDSYASGEGNPVNPPSSPVDQPSAASLHSMWGGTYGMNGCHRSDDAGIPRAFDALRAKYPGFDMKLVFVACGGSRIEHVTGRPNGEGPPAGTNIPWGDGIRGDANDERTDRWEPIAEPAQLEQVDDELRRLFGNGSSAPVDLLAMSIGGNDAGFAPIVGLCVQGGLPATIDGVDPSALVVAGLNPNECDENPDLADAVDDDGLPDRAPTGDATKDAAYTQLRHDVPGWNEVLRRYAALDATIERFNAATRPIGQVLITQYGVGLKDGNGNYCGGRAAATKNDLFGFIDTDEAAWLDTNLVTALNRRVSTAADRANQSTAGPRWKVVSGHVAPFLPHGPCSNEPWTNINSTALTAEGNNLPDKPFDTTRDSLATLNTVLATATGTAVGCAVGTMVVLLTQVGCAAGAGAGFVVGLATNPQQSAVSAGMAHPNKRGWQAVGDALEPDLEASFVRTFTPLPADHLREHGAGENGQIQLRWDDRSSTESRYEVEVYDAANTVTPVARVTNLPANTTDHTFNPSGPFVGSFRVRACNQTFCSPFSGRTKITNIRPGVPTGVSALRYTNESLAADLPDSLVVSGTDPHDADLATRIELTQTTDARGNAITANAKVFDVPAPFPSVFTFAGSNGLPDGRYRVRAASCNVFGCSDFSGPSDSKPAPPPPPKLEEELPPFFLDARGAIVPRRGDLPLPGDPTGQPQGPSVTIPSPVPPGG